MKRKVHIPRIMIAAASSGSGKTLFTCGLLDVISGRGTKPAAYKCGPDYIDPMFHREVQGIDSDNLDPFFCDADELKNILTQRRDACAIVEGVMGIYDGMSVEDTRASCYEAAVMTQTPILLIESAAGVGRTVISQIKGLLADDDRRQIKGIILNRISERFYEKLKPCLEKELKDAGYDDVRLIGGMPAIKDMELKSRHLGLKMPGEIEDIREKIGRLGREIEEHCDIEEILKIMESAEDLTAGDKQDRERHRDSVTQEERPLIAVARDEAFCFYYGENLRLLEEAGARLVFFSPIHDKKLPEGAAGLLLGGGYPELHLKELGSNKSMLDHIREALRSGMPSIAECGGFMYLHRSVSDKQGKAYPLVGAVDGDCTDTGRPVRFGYLQVVSDDDGGDKAFGSVIAGLKGHEFHYYESTACGNSCLVEKPVTKERWRCMICDDRRMWGYPHFYYGSCTAWLQGFIRAAKEYEHG